MNVYNNKIYCQKAYIFVLDNLLGEIWYLEEWTKKGKINQSIISAQFCLSIILLVISPPAFLFYTVLMIFLFLFNCYYFCFYLLNILFCFFPISSYYALPKKILSDLSCLVCYYYYYSVRADMYKCGFL